MPARFSRFRIGRRAALLALLLTTAAPLAAAELRCGTYRSEDGSARLLVDSPAEATRLSDAMPPTRYLVRQRGTTLDVVDLSLGHADQYTLSDDGQRIEGGYSGYALAEAAACKAPAPAPAGSCRADIDACIARTYDADDRQLRQWCREDLPFACSRLLERYREQAREAATAGDPDLVEPDVCKQDSPLFDESACRTAAHEALAKAMARSLLGVDHAGPRLPAASLQDLMQLCRAHPDGDFCTKVADEHWNAGQYLQAREALQLACSPGLDPGACGKAAALAGLRPADATAAPAAALPCGDYRAAVGLMDSLSFGDHGLVEVPFGGQLRARLEDGQVRIRHDKGGDFVFQVLDGQRLLGLDNWNRYALYQRQGGADRCAAPVVYVERPLPQDCPAVGTPGGAEACCAAGKLQGCNALGHHKALTGDWSGAAPYYRKLCEAGVRAGCENLRGVFGNTGDDTIPETLQRICLGDGAHTHVACDVHATSNWALLALGAGLQQAADALEAGGHDDGDDGEATAPHPQGKFGK